MKKKLDSARLHIYLHSSEKKEELGLCYYLDDDVEYNVIPYEDDDPDKQFVLLKWVPERILEAEEMKRTGIVESYYGEDDDERQCVLAEYFPTFEAALIRLVELEGEEIVPGGE